LRIAQLACSGCISLQANYKARMRLSVDHWLLSYIRYGSNSLANGR
ncbi:hypothetical protein CEXT_475421, partial [Caerostris extrusa]